MRILATRGNTRIRVLVGCALVGLFCWQLGWDSETDQPNVVRAGGMVQPAIAYTKAPAITTDLTPAELVKSDPMKLLEVALQRYQTSISDYTCTFTKQERIDGKLGDSQQIAVRFCEMPFSVLMEWVKNPGDARRVLYVQGRWQNDDGEDLAKIEPQGAIARLLVKSVTLPINGSMAKSQSRRTIDQFGFGNALKLIIDYARLAIDAGQGSIVYLGEDEHEGRKTWVLQRTLPYTADNCQWPDRVLIVEVDQQWLLPVACQTYADDQKQHMLASYVFSDIHLNNGLTADDFDPKANGF